MAYVPRTLHGFAAAGAVGCILCAGYSFADEKSADRLTQTALNLDAHPAVGKNQYERSCSRCHRGRGQGDAAQLVPELAGQRFTYLIRQMADFMSGERDNAAMAHALSDARLAGPQSWNNVAAYLNRLPATGVPQTGDGSTAALGRGIFHEQCASCHRGDASGDEQGYAPSLRNQHYQYLVNQLHRLADDHRRNLDPSLQLFMRSFDDADIVALADYLSRQRGPPTSHKRMLSNGVVVN